MAAAAAAPEDCSRQGPSGKGKPTTSTMYYGLVFPRKSISTPYTPSSSCSSSAFLPAFACSSAVCLFLQKTQLSDQGNGKISVKVAWALLPLPHVTKSYFYWKRNSTNPMTSSIKISCLCISWRYLVTKLWKLLYETILFWIHT